MNCDGEDTLRQILEDKKVTWPCWADGKGGPISRDWQVESYPQMYVIDQDGVIRHKFAGQTRPGQLKQTVSKMVDDIPVDAPPADGAAAKVK